MALDVAPVLGLRPLAVLPVNFSPINSHRPHRLQQAAEKCFLLSSRAQRGICFFANPKKKADSSGNIRPRNDEIGVEGKERQCSPCSYPPVKCP
jgi:hypothetical protein